METRKAQDFTVILEVPPHLEDCEDLTAIYWAWAKRVLRKDRHSYEYMNVDGLVRDNNQNEIFNVNIGRDNLGHLAYMQKMGKLLKEHEKNRKERTLIRERKAGSRHSI